MQTSSKRTPCPVCSRTKDGDCRFTSDLILCHSGTDLRPSDTLTIDGQQWYLSRLNAGYDGAAAVFKPHRSTFKPTGNRHVDADRLAKRSVATFSIQRFLDHFQLAWDLDDFHALPPADLQGAFDLIDTTAAEGIALSRSLAPVWRDHSDLADLYRWRVESCVKSLQAQAKDAHSFRRYYLGEAL